MTTTLRGARLADGRVVDVAIDPVAGTITSVTEPVERALVAFGANDIDLRGHMVLPSFAEPHAHLDKALTADLVPNLTGDLHGAITGWIDFLPTLTTEAIVERAVIALDELIASGVTTVRTHVNLDRATGMRALDALLEVRRRVGERADVQIVALFSFVGEQHEGWREQRALVRDAVSGEPTLIVGGCPHIEIDPLVATRFSVDLAAEFERPIDLHTDETLHASSLDVLHLADLAGGWSHGTVVASHCVSLGMQPADDQRRIAERLAEAGVHVVTLPQTNLFLQGRDSRTATPRVSPQSMRSSRRVLVSARGQTTCGIPSTPWVVAIRWRPLRCSSWLATYRPRKRCVS